MVRREQSRTNTWLVSSRTVWVARELEGRGASRETTETTTIAAMKQAAILMPSGRSMTLLTVV